jgi:nitroimidazol reductase NimA-like FMN-containing flavoprotein (pyridoxamine 5'-phosphate oxidase superfamily)
MKPIKKTARSRVKRRPKRGVYDRETINAILDEALIAHVGFDLDGAPAVIPTAIWRAGDRLHIHGSAKSAMLLALKDGAEACICATLLDGLVLARSAFHHSMNYRSVVLYGRATEVTDAQEKAAALRGFTEKLAPGRWDEIRGPNRQELKATIVLAFPIEEASAKIRVGPPIDDEADHELPVWAGVVPVHLAFGAPVSDPAMRAATPVPRHARHLGALARKRLRTSA